MNLIEKLGLEKCKAIVDGAPDWAVSVNLHNGMYYDLREVSRGDLWLMDIRTAIANHEKCQHEWNETTSNGDAYRFFVCKHCDSTQNYVPFEVDYCTDIRNHISPLTEVTER